MDELGEEIPLFLLLGCIAFLHGVAECFLHVSALLLSADGVNKGFDLKHIIEDSPRLLPGLLGLALSRLLLFLAFLIVLFLPLSLGLWRLRFLVSALLAFSALLSLASFLRSECCGFK